STVAKALMRQVRPVTAAVVACLVALPAFAQSKGERLDLLEQRMDNVERQFENQGLLELSRQVEALTEELRRLRGDFEQVQHELERARAQQRDQYVDLDTRLKAAETALASAQASATTGTPEAEYQAAFNLLKEGKYDEAAAALRDFLGRHKDHELASNAMYWLGESHYVRRDYPAALAAFESMLRDYPGARKAPDALLKAGYCQYELKRYGPARASLTRLVQDYPETPAAAEAKARLERLGAEGR
ncbi:MAG: tol-pal system protein YbgF, partial [Steroidobacteraceae bacterium]